MSPTTMRRFGATAASVAALLGLALIVPGQAMAQKTITIVVPEEPDSLDNCNANRSNVGRILRMNVNESLIELDPNDGSLMPRLATSWKMINPTTWEFKLRPNVKYSDGSPLTISAIRSSVDKALSKDIDCNARTKLFSDITLKFVEIDPLTMNIITSSPEPILPIRMSTITIGAPNEKIAILNTSVGTGPYMLDYWKANTEIVLKRNPHFWGKKPLLDGAKYVWRNESAVAAAMVEVGEAELATNINQDDATNPETDFAYPNSETNYLRIESEVAPLNDKRVRLALNHAVDREAMHGGIIPKDAMIATQMVIPRINGHNHELDKQRFAYDPALAKKLLAEAKADGVPVDTEIELICRINMWANTTETCEAIHAMYSDVGFNIKLKMLEVSLWNDFNAHPNKGEYTPAGDSKIKGRAPVLLGHQHDNNIGDPIFSMYNKFGCKAQTSSHCYPALDAQIADASRTPAGPERIAKWQESMRMVHEDYVADVFLYHMVGFARVSPKINFVPTAATNSEVLLEQITFK